MVRNANKIAEILKIGKKYWKTIDQRPEVLREFTKVCECGTIALGAEEFRSSRERRVVYHTCKSKMCPRCGRKATTEWLRQAFVDLPDISYVHITFTMPDRLWGIYNLHRELEHHLPALAASAIEQWAWRSYKVRLIVIAVDHTFGKWLTFNPHVHMLASKGGLREPGGIWIDEFDYPEYPFTDITKLWQRAIIDHLSKAFTRGLLHEAFSTDEFAQVIECQGQRDDWSVMVSRRKTKYQILSYAGRYVRHPPISNRRIVSYSEDRVVFTVTKKLTYEEIVNRIPAEISVVSLSLEEFIERLVIHVQESYRHAMRYFGLWAPRGKRLAKPALFNALGQRMRSRPERQSRAAMIKKQFGVDVMRDSFGETMIWTRTLKARRDNSNLRRSGNAAFEDL